MGMSFGGAVMVNNQVAKFTNVKNYFNVISEDNPYDYITDVFKVDCVNDQIQLYFSDRLTSKHYAVIKSGKKKADKRIAIWQPTLNPIIRHLVNYFGVALEDIEIRLWQEHYKGEKFMVSDYIVHKEDIPQLVGTLGPIQKADITNSAIDTYEQLLPVTKKTDDVKEVAQYAMELANSLVAAHTNPEVEKTCYPKEEYIRERNDVGPYGGAFRDIQDFTEWKNGKGFCNF